MIQTYISFNINGIRARPHQLAAVIEKFRPTLIGLQETKVHDDMFPVEIVTDLGYRPIYHGQKGHYGVAMLVPEKDPSGLTVGKVVKGFPGDAEDAQRRFIGVELLDSSGSPLWVYNGYFPQGEGRKHPLKFPAKEAFYANLYAYLKSQHQPSDKVIVMGDMNVSPQDNDIGIGEKNAKRWLSTGKCSFLPEEREWYQQLLSFGLTDSFRNKYPDSDQLSWFDYRSRGFTQDPKHGLRIDHILLTQTLMNTYIDAGIDYDIRAMEKSSDHCPIWVTCKA